MPIQSCAGNRPCLFASSAASIYGATRVSAWSTSLLPRRGLTGFSDGRSHACLRFDDVLLSANAERLFLPTAILFARAEMMK